ncbi:MAG: hypothetical protein J6386_03085 [Candidatus Synoicihabitans palmerolidicus]|nr:hypothetical protein [Candidatus Synoicihabitans palmerolidicus]
MRSLTHETPDRNRFGLFVSYDGPGPPDGGSGSYGSGGSKFGTAWPLNQWVTVDILVDMENGYRLYQDGVEVANKLNVLPPREDALECKALGVTIRLMHGGNPHQNMPVRDYEEYFKDFEIFIYE